MFEKPWTSIKRMLLTGLCLTTLLAPYESEAAPKNKNRSTRISKKVRQETKRQNKRQQQQSRQQNREPVKPTLEENLSPAQVDQKIRTIRRRIEMAPEDMISSRDKEILLEVFDDVVQTPIGRYTLEKASPNLNFYVGSVRGAANYAVKAARIGISRRNFDDIQRAKTSEERRSLMFGIGCSLIHEATHSVQHTNKMNNRENMSFEENMTIFKLFELHSSLHEEVVGYQMGNLPKYRSLIQKNTIKFTPAQRFYQELVDAYKSTGMTEEKACRSASTKFVETFWRNNTKTPIQIGERVIHPTESRVNITIESWHTSYNFSGFSRLPRRNISYDEAMRDRGIEPQLKRFINAMGIDIKPSFFKDSKTGAFDMPSTKRLLGYANGIRNYEIDAITTGIFSKGYENGALSYVYIKTNRGSVGEGVQNYTEYYEGTRQKKSTYTYKNGKMNGVYREYDRQGRQILEIPVDNDETQGDGWAIENGKKVLKIFRKGTFVRNRTRE